MKKSKNTMGRPPMKQSQHPAHNMPAEQHDGTQLPIGNGSPAPNPIDAGENFPGGLLDQMQRLSTQSDD